MKISYSSDPLEKLKTEAIAIGLFEEEPLHAEARKLDHALSNHITSVLKSKDFKGELNETYAIHTNSKIPAKRIFLVGLGKKKEFDFDAARQAAATAVQACLKHKITAFSATIFGAGVKGPTSALAAAITEGAVLGNYSFKTFLTGKEKEKSKPVESLEIAYHEKAELAKFREHVEAAAKLAEIVNYCRELQNLPPNVATPEYLGAESEKLGRKYGFKVTIYDKKGIEKLGFNALLAVNSGSAKEPRFIVLEYKKSAGSAPICLVGKAITFDSGGLNIKSSDYMNNMKFDKCGGIAVLGAVCAAAVLELPVHLIGLIPATENLPSGSAYKVGDIYTAYNGKTLEIGNTDAEGRVILSDALAYTKEFRPKAVIDLATLTGACVIALGHEAAGLMGNDSKLLSKIKDAADITAERVWELPMYKEYNELIKSDVADVKNIGDGTAGVISAAKFLENFIPEGVQWAHLDIAGVAWTEKGKYKPYFGKGATGYGIRLLVELLKNWKSGACGL